MFPVCSLYDADYFLFRFLLGGVFGGQTEPCAAVAAAAMKPKLS